MKKNDLDKNNERGFILVTSIILLAILMGLGAAAMFKTQVEIKVSAGAVESAQALASAQAGLDYTYYYWSQVSAGQTEFADLADAASSGTGAPAIMLNVNVETLADLGATAADIDTWVQTGSSGAGLRVYTLDGTMNLEGTRANWGSDTYAQVAVWTARYKPSTSGYPYKNYKAPTATGCSDCTAVTYSLGRSKNAYKLLREYSFTSSSTIQAFGAMMNAPKYNGDVDCSTPTASITVTTSSPGDPTSVPSGTTLWQTSHLIDATQAPEGIAMASNNGINPFITNKAWDTLYGTGTTMATDVNGTIRAIDMYIVYDPGKVDSVNYPEISGGQMSATWATTVRDSLFVPPDTPMNYFTDGKQLFPLDAYREAANRISGFRDETIGTYLVQPVGVGGGANTPLTQEVIDLKANNGGFGRAGTLNWTELTNNITNSVPMYGLLRFMIPMVVDNSKAAVSVCGRTAVDIFKPRFNVLGVGSESPDGKLIVYGGALFDFYNDANTNGTYDAGESLLTRDEAQASDKVNVDNPLMFNPVMDGMVPSTVAVGGGDYLNINDYPAGSPSWDLRSDAFTFGPGSGTNNADGVMDLVWDVDKVARGWSSLVKTTGGAYVWTGLAQNERFNSWMSKESPAVITSTATSVTGSHVWSNADKTRMKTLLDYYIRTTSEGSKNVWFNSTGASGTNLSQIEADYASFYIDTGNDLVRPTASAADLYHTFLPSGYIHGWKRGIKVTGLAKPSANDATKSIWNIDLIQDNGATVSPSSAKESKTFFITGVDANARIDQDFVDIPAEMYAGGLVDMHHAVNTSGVVYTPDMLELEQKDKGTQGITNGNDDGSGNNSGAGRGAQAALQYINGIVISGIGVYMKDETASVGSVANARTVIAYDDTSIDNLPTNSDTPLLGRKYWQELK